MSKLAEDAEKAQSRAQRASEVLMDDLDTELAQTAYEVVYQEDRVRLKHYIPTTDIRLKTPLLVVYALINLDGANTGFLHLLGDVDPDSVKEGMRVEAVFAEERKGSPLDIAYFRPLEE